MTVSPKTNCRKRVADMNIETSLEPLLAGGAAAAGAGAGAIGGCAMGYWYVAPGATPGG